MKSKAALATLVALSVATSASAQETLRIATEGAYPPFNFVTSAGELSGFDVEIARALCEEMQRECEIVAQDWDGIIPGLVNDKYDAIVASMSITEERMKAIDFTDPYYSNYISILGRTSEGLTLEDLDDKTVGSQRATTGATWIEDRFGRRGDVRLYDSYPALFADLEAGRIDAAVSDYLAAADYLKDHPDFGYVADKINVGDKIGIGIRHGEDALKQALNAAIAAIREDGIYQEISEKYFSADIY